MNTYFPVALENLARPDENMVEYLTRVVPDFECSLDAVQSMDHYTDSVQNTLRRIFPKELIDYASRIDSVDDIPTIREFYRRLSNACPFASWSKAEDQQAPYTMTLSVVCRGERTHGVGRFLSDIFSQWLIPGKQLPLRFVQSFVFRFQQHVNAQYLLHEVSVLCENANDLAFCQAHVEELLREVRLIILSVQHARKVISLQELTIDQKKMIIQENILTQEL